jgi:hypothetical protein
MLISLVIWVCKLTILRFQLFHSFFSQIELFLKFIAMFTDPNHTLLENILILQVFAAFNLNLFVALSELADHLHLKF